MKVSVCRIPMVFPNDCFVCREPGDMVLKCTVSDWGSEERFDEFLNRFSFYRIMSGINVRFVYIWACLAHEGHANLLRLGV